MEILEHTFIANGTLLASARLKDGTLTSISRTPDVDVSDLPDFIRELCAEKWTPAFIKAYKDELQKSVAEFI